MPKLSQFTINSDYPATAKVGGVPSTNITMPATTFGPNQDMTFISDMTVEPEQILMPIIKQGANYFVGNGYLWQNDNWREEVWIERLGPTTIRFVFYVINYSNQTLTHPGNDLTLFLNTFTMP